MRELVLRAANPDEVDRVIEFYGSPANFGDEERKHILPRPEAVKLAAEDSLFFVVVSGKGKIVAASGVFDVDATDHIEVGGTGVAKSHRGHGLQNLLIQVRTAGVVANYGPSTEIITAVDPTNEHSLENVKKGGFVSWPQPLEAFLESCVGCPKKPSLPPGRVCCCDFYLLPTNEKKKLVKELLNLTSTDLAILSNSKKPVPVSLELNLVVGEHRQDLEAFVK